MKKTMFFVVDTQTETLDKFENKESAIKYIENRYKEAFDLDSVYVIMGKELKLRGTMSKLKITLDD